MDATMTENYKTDIGKLAYVGKQGVLCLLSESIYAEKQGYTSPNNRVASFIREVLLKNENRNINAIFMWKSNIKKKKHVKLLENLKYLILIKMIIYIKN